MLFQCAKNSKDEVGEQMKFSMKLSAIGLATLTAILATSIQSRAQALYGYVVINVVGGFRTTVSAGGSVNCSGFLALVPTTSSGPTIANLSALALLSSAVQKSSAIGVINSAKTNFTCTVVVPYQLNNANTASQQLVIGFSADARDPGVYNPSNGTFTGATNPGKTKQLIQIVPVPTTSGTTLTYDVSAYL
jgi:hypothetical protein